MYPVPETWSTFRAIPGILLLAAAGASGTDSAGAEKARSLNADLLIAGGTESGCAAAVQAARMGVESIVLVTDGRWLGGQFSSQGLVAIDENANVGGTRHKLPIPRSGLFKETIERIEELNRRKHGRARPGNTRVITTCRPADAAQVFADPVQPYVESGQLTIVHHRYAVQAEVDENHRLQAVHFAKVDDPQEEPVLTVRARLTIDASDWGEVIQAAGAEYEFGPDLKSKYGEPEAPASRDEYPVTDMNPITYTMVIVETGEHRPIPEPEHYDVRKYDKLPYPQRHDFFYTSRRIVDHYNHREVRGPDVILLCYPGHDYPLDVLPEHVAEALEADEPGASKRNIVEMTRRQRQIVFEDAKQHSLGQLYWLQTVLHDRLKDKTHSFRRFVLSDEFGTPDRLPPKPYIREGLRLKALYMMRQQDSLPLGKDSDNYAQVWYHDTVGAWQFEYDFHPTKRKFLTGERSGPWQATFRPLRNWGPPYSGKATFPLRSLIPKRVDGLLAAQHNLGFSSIVSSALRLHDHSMAIGQAAGAAAAVSLERNVPPRAIPFDRQLLTAVQRGLCRRGEEAQPAMLWPFRDLAPEHPAFVPANLLAATGGLPLGPSDVDFQAAEPASSEWREQVVQLSLRTREAAGAKPSVPRGEMTRGEFVIAWWKQIRDLPEKPFPRKAAGDADGDEIPDAEDALPFDRDNDNTIDF